MSEYRVTETDIIEFMHSKVQRLTRTIQALLTGKPVTGFLEGMIAEECNLSKETVQELAESFNPEQYQVVQVLCPISRGVMKEVISGKYNLLDELWPDVKEALALEIATYVLRHNQPTYDFDTKVLMKQMLYPEERD